MKNPTAMLRMMHTAWFLLRMRLWRMAKPIRVWQNTITRNGSRKRELSEWNIQTTPQTLSYSWEHIICYQVHPQLQRRSFQADWSPQRSTMPQQTRCVCKFCYDSLQMKQTPDTPPPRIDGLSWLWGTSCSCTGPKSCTRWTACRPDFQISIPKYDWQSREPTWRWRWGRTLSDGGVNNQQSCSNPLSSRPPKAKSCFQVDWCRWWACSKWHWLY